MNMSSEHSPQSFINKTFVNDEESTVQPQPISRSHPSATDKEKTEASANKDAEDEDLRIYLQKVEAHLMLDEDIAETKCGLGSCTPDGIQWLARKEIYLVFYWIIGIVAGMFFTYSFSVNTTVEKRFKLSSKESGVIMAGNDISQVMLAIVVAYYGSYGNRPLWMAIGILSIAVSCFTAALPHFIYGPGQDALDIIKLQMSANETMDESRNIELCNAPYDQECESLNRGLYFGPKIYLFMSQFFVGIGVAIYWSVGLPYLDDNISKKTSPQLYSVSMMVRIIGPVMGFFLGSKCLSIWIDPAETPTISLKDPRWLGAWWIGYLYVGIGLTLVGLLIGFFPKKLPETLQREVRRVAQQVAKEEKRGGKRPVTFFVEVHRKEQTKEQPSMKNLPKALMRLFTNKIYMGNLFNTCTYVLAVSGYWSFKSKYLENQFRKSASEANRIMGISSAISTVVGSTLCGLWMRYWKPGPKFISGYLCFLTLWSCAQYVSLMFVGCPKLDILGPIATVEGSLPPSCSLDCGCTDRFEPVCSSDGQTVFYSACYAGCSSVNSSASPPVYSDCKCISNSTTDELSSIPTLIKDFDSNRMGTAVRGYCEESCDTMIFYLVIVIISNIVYATGRVGSFLIQLRSVADHDKGIAMGLQTVMMSLTAFIPAPIIMGAVVDSACIVWDTTCGKEGNCWFYDSEKFRYIVHVLPAIIILISILGDFVVYYYSDQMDIYGEKDPDDLFEDDKEKCPQEKDEMHGTITMKENPKLAS